LCGTLKTEIRIFEIFHIQRGRKKIIISKNICRVFSNFKDAI
jgi:hypothetical protein